MMVRPLASLAAPLELPALFGRNALLEVEIGVGKGRFLRERATAFPERNFLGLDRSHKWLGYAAARIEKTGIGNVRLIEGWAQDLVEWYLPARSVAAYHIYFPDPWPKRRHTKRRLFTPPFLSHLFRTLAPGGELLLATDHLDYFAAIHEVLTPFGERAIRYEELSGLPFVTNYEAKYRREGRPIRYGRIQLRGDAGCDAISDRP